MAQRQRWLAVWAAVLLLWNAIRLAFQRGMFVDGVTYAVLSRNLSEGLGTLWQPFYTATNAPVFEGHPPLAFWGQALWYRIFGDVFWIDGWHGIVLVLATAGVVATGWRSRSAIVAWPLLLVTLTPLLMWSAQNNMLENALVLWATTAILCIVRGLERQQWGWWLAGSFFVLLGWWVKGPVGLYPLAVPLWWWLSQGRSGLSANVFWRSVLALGLGLVAWAALWSYCFPDSVDFVTRYLAVQLSPALQNEIHVTASFRAEILLVAMQQLVVPSVLGGALLLYGRWRKISIPPLDRQMAFFWGLVAISATLPLMLTLKQRRFYLVPAVWASVLAWSYATAPMIAALVAAIPRRVWRSLQVIVVVAALAGIGVTVRDWGKLSRDEGRQNLAMALSTHLAPHTTVGVPKDWAEDWRLHAYLMRYGYLSIAVDEALEWQLVPASGAPPISPTGSAWEEVLALEDWVLYRAP